MIATRCFGMQRAYPNIMNSLLNKETVLKLKANKLLLIFKAKSCQQSKIAKLCGGAENCEKEKKQRKKKEEQQLKKILRSLQF